MGLNRAFIFAVAALGLAGCADRVRPIIDPATSVAGGRNYEYDVSQCQQIAKQVDAGGRTVGGALVGGAVGGGASAADSTQNIVRNCMIRRGYAVLD
jgi:outer membrane lipoprotein SlyB